MHEFAITGSIARQPLIMAAQACKCWFVFISNKCNGLMFNMDVNVGSFLLAINAMALCSIWKLLYQLISEQLSFINS